MSEDKYNIKTPLFSLGIQKKDNAIILNEGQTILLRYWSWKKFGYIRKAIVLKNGNVLVQRVD